MEILNTNLSSETIVNYEEKIEKFLKDNLSEKAFHAYTILSEKLPKIWNRRSSSTNKHHIRESTGESSTIGEHVYELLYSSNKIISMFNIKEKSSKSDIIYLSIFFHDIFKYGKENYENKEHTDRHHDRLIGDFVEKNFNFFNNFLNEEEIKLLENIVRYHSGRFSSDAQKKDFYFGDYHPYVMFVHMMDMLSSRNCLRSD